MNHQILIHAFELPLLKTYKKKARDVQVTGFDKIFLFTHQPMTTIPVRVIVVIIMVVRFNIIFIGIKCLIGALLSTIILCKRTNNYP
jgi:hypothetical protein